MRRGISSPSFAKNNQNTLKHLEIEACRESKKIVTLLIKCYNKEKIIKIEINFYNLRKENVA